MSNETKTKKIQAFLWQLNVDRIPVGAWSIYMGSDGKCKNHEFGLVNALKHISVECKSMRET